MAIYLGFTPIAFWIWFSIYRKKSHTSSLLILFTFVFGILATLFALFAETNVLKIMPFTVYQCLASACTLNSSKEVIALLQLCILVIGPIEELGKFFGIWFVVRKRQGLAINDYIKIGFAAGLGFAAMENAIYIYRLLGPYGVNYELVVATLILRFFLSTSAHILYTGFLGYYYGLYKTNLFKSRTKLIFGIIFVIILHGAFDFFLFGNLPIYALLLTIFMGGGIVAIMIEKKNNEVAPIYESTPLEPVTAEIKIKGSEVIQQIQPLNKCPICLTPNTLNGKFCSNCGAKLGV